MQADGPLRSYHWAVKDYAGFATPSQTDRFVHDIARLHLGYLAEAAWAETRHVPQVWEYLVMRQFNNFRPCLSIVDAVEAGLARDRARRESDSALGALRERFDTLSSREREIMMQVTAGRLNKQIASDIGIAESTVKVHRTNLMRKMKARSLPELSRMADMLKLAPEKPPGS